MIEPCFICAAPLLCPHREPKLVAEYKLALAIEEGWRAKEAARQMKWGRVISVTKKSD